MAGLDPAIHEFLVQDVDARHEAGHDGGKNGAPVHPSTFSIR